MGAFSREAKASVEGRENTREYVMRFSLTCNQKVNWLPLCHSFQNLSLFQCQVDYFRQFDKRYEIVKLTSKFGKIEFPALFLFFSCFTKKVRENCVISTFVHSKCKRSLLRSQSRMRLFLLFSNTVVQGPSILYLVAFSLLFVFLRSSFH